eukprot:6892590-Prymnesium_polylepis.1
MATGGTPHTCDGIAAAAAGCGWWRASRGVSRGDAPPRFCAVASSRSIRPTCAARRAFSLPYEKPHESSLSGSGGTRWPLRAASDDRRALAGRRGATLTIVVTASGRRAVALPGRRRGACGACGTKERGGCCSRPALHDGGFDRVGSITDRSPAARKNR